MIPHKSGLILDSDMLAVAFSGRKAPLAEKPVEATPGASELVRNGRMKR